MVDVVTNSDIVLRSSQAVLVQQNAAHLVMFVMFQSDRSVSRFMCTELIRANLLKRILALSVRTQSGSSWLRMICLMMSRHSNVVDACVRFGLIPIISVCCLQYHAQKLSCIDVILEQMLHISKHSYFCRTKLTSCLSDLMPFLTDPKTSIQAGLVLLAMVEGEILIMHAVLREGLFIWINILLCTYRHMDTAPVEVGLETIHDIFQCISEKRIVLHLDSERDFSETTTLLIAIASAKPTVSRMCKLIVSLLRSM